MLETSTFRMCVSWSPHSPPKQNLTTQSALGADQGNEEGVQHMGGLQG